MLDEKEWIFICGSSVWEKHLRSCGVAGHALIFDVWAGRISLTFLSICSISLLLFKRTSTHSQRCLNIKKSEIKEVLLIFKRSHNHYTRKHRASISWWCSQYHVIRWYNMDWQWTKICDTLLDFKPILPLFSTRFHHQTTLNIFIRRHRNGGHYWGHMLYQDCPITAKKCFFCFRQCPFWFRKCQSSLEVSCPQRRRNRGH